MTDILIRDTLIVIRGNEVVRASLYISEGKIRAIVKDYSHYLGKANEVIDGRGLITLPGGIDVHTHIYDPDYTHHEDFKTGSLAALFGGITTIFDMPLRMYVDNVEKLRLKIKEGLKTSYINFGIHAGMMNEENITNIKELKNAGIHAFKLFTCKPFRPKTDAGITKVIDAISKAGGLPFIHAEDDALIDYLISKFRSEGRDDPLAHHESRPPEAEASAIERVVNIAEYLGIRIHVAHVSSRLGAEAIRRAKERGVKVTAETCPQYLYFTKDDVKRLGNLLKMNPSLKTSSDREYLWRALANGVIDAVASDNAPSPKEEKEVDVWSAWGGIPSLEVMLPLIFTLGFTKLRLLTLERFLEVTSRNPAKIMGLWPMKGELAVGSDADLILIDRGLCFKVRSEDLHHKVEWSPFEGLELCGWPRHVIINGKVLLRDRELIEENRAPKYV